MATLTEQDTKLAQTPTGWMVTGLSYPRITVLGATRDGALAAYREQRDTWLAEAEAPHE